MTDMLKAANDQPPEFKYYVDLALHSLMLHVCTARLKRKGSLGERIREEVSLGERAPLQAGHARPPKKHKPSQLVQAAARALWAVAWPVITHKLEEAGLGGWVGVWCSWLAGRRVVCAHCCRARLDELQCVAEEARMIDRRTFAQRGLGVRRPLH